MGEHRAPRRDAFERPSPGDPVLAAAGSWARRFAAESRPWTNVYGLARTLLALSSALTLAFTPTSALFVPVYGADPAARCKGVTQITAFCLDHSASHAFARALVVAALLVVASGWRPRWTALLHVFVTFSIANDLSILDGGDHVCLDLSLLLLPIALTDRRRWHWAAPAEESGEGARTGSPPSLGDEARRLVAAFAGTLIRIQVAAIYFHAAIGKFGVEDWTDGTAVYYFFGNPMYGASHSVLAVLRPILVSPVGVAALTWGSLMLEYFLSAALVMSKRHWRPMLYAGLSLHAGIIVVHGLLSFAVAMFAALILFLRPSELAFDFARWVPAKRKPSIDVQRKGLIMNSHAVASWVKVGFLGLVVFSSLASAACAGEAGDAETVGQSAAALKIINPNPSPIPPVIGPGGGGYAPIPVYPPTVFSAGATSNTVTLSWNEHGGNGQTILYRQLYDLAGNPTGSLTAIHTFTALPAGPVTYTDSNAVLRLQAPIKGALGVGGIIPALDPIQPDRQIGYQIVEVASGYAGCEYVPGGSTCASASIDAYTQSTIPYGAGRAELQIGVAAATSHASSLHLRTELSAWNATWLDSTHGDFTPGSSITYDLLTDYIDVRSDILFLDLWTPDNDGVCINDIRLKIDNTTTFHQSFSTCQWVGNGGNEIMIPFPALRSNAAWQSYAPHVFTTSNNVPVTFVGFDGPGLIQHLDAAVGDALKNPIPTPADGANATLGSPTTISRTDATHLHVQQHLVNLQVEWDDINFGTVSADPSYDLVIHHADSACTGWCVALENASGNTSYGWAGAILDVLTLGVVPIIEHEVNNHLQNALSGMKNSLPNPDGFGYCFVPTQIDHGDPGPVEASYWDDGTAVPFGLGSLTICPVTY
jgi:antimicrobial peptide system SdpB family protein